MATKKQNEPVIDTTEATDVKPIVLRDEKNGDVFILEFNRTSVKYAESRGFSIQTLNDSGVSITIIEDLFNYAFRMHHPNMSKADTDKILYDKLKGMPDGMVERLIMLYAIPLNTLVQTEESAKNATMTVEF